MRRINVVGASGSGKSIFARALAKRLMIPVIEMDALFWSQNWTPVAESEFITKLGKVVSGEKWILDGNYHRTKDLKWSRVETIIWLDFSFLCIFKRALSRALLRIWRKQEIWAGTGNRETWARTFLSKDSVLLWTLTSYNEVKRRYAGIYKNQAGSPYQVVRLASPGQARAFLAALV
jgi:adenylate kinase family enzyme